MARSVNVLTHGLSGMIGKQLVFRTWNGKTYISVAPRKPKKQSPLQKDNRQKFKMATLFAKKMMKDPEKKAEYQDIAKKMKLPNAYTAAITEYMRKPELHQADLASYTGKAGEKITVTTRKKGFELQDVEVLIANKDGEVVEEGKALKVAPHQWVFTTSANHPISDEVQFLIKGRDRAGNTVSKTFAKKIS